MITYCAPEGIRSEIFHHHIYLSTASGGKIALDNYVHMIWQMANGKSMEDILSRTCHSEVGSNQILATLACLVEAGLLSRKNDQPPNKIRENEQAQTATPKEHQKTVSAIIVSHKSLSWLEKCLTSLLAQNYPPLEIIMVDNASQDGCIEWIKETFPSIKLLPLDEIHTLAAALNLGIAMAQGEFFLVLNPDVELEPDALGNMIEVIEKSPSCAAVAAKMMLRWAPAFLNGLGNVVGNLSWGTDNALGHLDLGQFDSWNEVPSACFAAALIPCTIYKEVGEFDEEFPLYYEDSEWCYRARLLGYSVHAAPKAIIFHAYNEKFPGIRAKEISPTKLRYVCYGRLRFATKLLGWKRLIQFISCYFIEDILRIGVAIVQGQWITAITFIEAWIDYSKSLPDLRAKRGQIQRSRKCSDKDIFKLQRSLPMPLVWDGFPCLTWDNISGYYLPLIITKETHQLPEMSEVTFPDSASPTIIGNFPIWNRSKLILRYEGFNSLVYWMRKRLQWRLMLA